MIFYFIEDSEDLSKLYGKSIGLIYDYRKILQEYIRLFLVKYGK